QKNQHKANKITEYFEIDKDYSNWLKNEKLVVKINLFKKLTENLLGKHFICEFSEMEFSSIFKKVFTSKFDIKQNDEIVGIGLCFNILPRKSVEMIFRKGFKPRVCLCAYKNDSERKIFADRNHYLDCKCVKCIEIMKEIQFPILKFPEDSSKDKNLKKSIIICQRFLSCKEVRSVFKDRFKIEPKPCVDKMKKLNISFSKQENIKSDFTSRGNKEHIEVHLAWTYRDDDKNEEIYINEILKKRLLILERDLDANNEEISTIIVYISILILHEMAHLVLRWNGQRNSPRRIVEAGNYLESIIFGGVIRIQVTHIKPWNEKSQIIGMLLESSLDRNKLKRISFEKYVDPIFKNSTEEYFLIEFDDIEIDETSAKVLKQSDEQILSRSYSMPPGTIILEDLGVQKCAVLDFSS
ncbi:unnamed protein product, partial [Brachionus calyciflorus]